MTRASGGGRTPARMIIGAVVLLAIAGGVYGLYKFLPADAATPKPANAGAVTPASTVPSPRSIAPEQPASMAAKDNNPAPMVLNQGRTTTDSTRPRPVDVTGGQQTGPGPQPLTTTNTAPFGGAAAPSSSDAPATVPTLTQTSSTVSSRGLIDAGDRAYAQNNLVAARESYSRALMSPETGSSDQAMLRSKLGTINEDLVFSPKVLPGDTLVETYTVVSGDSLEKIRRKRDLATDWRLIARVNRMSDPNNIRLGQKLKLVRGPFNAVVHKSDHRLDLFSGSPDDQGSWVFVRSFDVGLGADSGTPLGNFVIKNKMENPDWKNPKTGEYFKASDPMNPIGEYWMGWEGLGDSKVHTGFGLHGTIDPSSIGQSKSMGCVRMANDDVKLMYELLVERISTVRVVPN